MLFIEFKSFGATTFSMTTLHIMTCNTRVSE